MSFIGTLFSFLGTFFAFIGKLLAFIWGIVVQGFQAISTLLVLAWLFLKSFLEQDNQTKLIIAGSIGIAVAFLAFFTRSRKD